MLIFDKQEGKQSLEDSNPFKINLKPMETNNPFKINLGVVCKEGGELFAHQNSQSESLSMKQLSFVQNKIQSTTSDNPLSKSTSKTDFKKQSKNQLHHQQNNIKKYKQTLRILYNDKYWMKGFKEQENRKKIKKDASGTYNSQDLKKTQGCFKAARMPFNRENKQKINLSKKIQDHYIIGSFQNSSFQNSYFSIFELRQPNIQQIKPIIVKINTQQKYSPCIEYDPTSGRVFLFSNDSQQIVVMSTKPNEIACNVKIKYQRIDPCLYIKKYKNSLYLFVVGGYRQLNSQTVEGLKYIQIFNIERWDISLKPLVMRMGIGRISPILFCDDSNEDKIYIIGGCSLASINSYKKINFDINQDINFATNKTAILIQSSFIQDCLQSQLEINPLLANSINVRFQNPLSLVGGVVLYRKLRRQQKMELFLVGHKPIYTIKTLQNDIHIIESELLCESQLSKPNHKIVIAGKSIGYHRGQNNIWQLYQIGKKGKLQPVNVSLHSRQLKLDSDKNCQLI